MNSRSNNSVIRELSRLEASLKRLLTWPSPDSGLATHISELNHSDKYYITDNTLVVFPASRIDTGPLLASAGYSIFRHAPDEEDNDCWQKALIRISKRDALPRDRQTFAYRPSELVGIILGIRSSELVDNSIMSWIVRVIQDLPGKKPAADMWSLLLYHYAAKILGTEWPVSIPNDVNIYTVSELALMFVLHTNGVIEAPEEVMQHLSIDYFMQTAHSVEDQRRPERLAALHTAIVLSMNDASDSQSEGVSGRLRRGSSLGSKPALVVLVHGIRTSGRWMRRIKPVLEDEANCKVEMAGYGFLNLFQFLIPGVSRRRAIKIIERKINDATSYNRDLPLIIVAHSFGTYCVTQILKANPHIRPARLLFCGSIVANEFHWGSLSQMAGNDMQVINDLGTRDVWPLLAHSMTSGYGRSGAEGFQSPGIEDRCHDLTHSDFFSIDFVRKYWVPFIKDGVYARSEHEEEMLETPWWISILGVRLFLPWLYWIVIFVVAIGLLFMFN